MLDETLSCCCELAKLHDPFAVKVMKAGSTVGHLPKKISSTCSLFIMKGGVILYKVTDPDRKYSRHLTQGGIEICTLCDNTSSTKGLVDKVKTLLAVSNKSIKPNGEQNRKNPEKSRFQFQTQIQIRTDRRRSEPAKCMGYISRYKDTALH